jgi:hypothetical protein
VGHYSLFGTAGPRGFVEASRTMDTGRVRNIGTEVRYLSWGALNHALGRSLSSLQCMWRTCSAH